MLHQSTKTRVYEKLLSSLGSARQGKRELDILVSFVIGDTSSDGGKMIELLVEEGYPWDVISELLDEDLPSYTTSLDAALPGETIVLSAYAKKRKQWVAVHRARNGEQITAWAATEPLARRLAGLRARKNFGVRAVAPPRSQDSRPRAPGGVPVTPAPAARKPAAASEKEGAEEWRILF